MTVLRGRVVTPAGVLADGVLAVDGGLVTWVGPAAAWPPDRPPPPPSGRTLLPGLVDVHCHGGGGHGFPDADRAGAGVAVAHHLTHGTTTMLASLVSAPPEVLLERLDVLADLVETGEVAGVHLEGPFLSPQHCGAQDPAALLPGDPDLLRRLLERGRGTVRSMTLAPETARSRELLTVLREHGVLPSLGHTGASSQVLRGWVQAAGGPLSITHLFNGMPPWHHRDAGPVPACLAAAARGEAVVELVADGVHLADDTVAAVVDLVGPGQVALVTDAMAAAGMPDGRYPLGPLDVTVCGGVARLSGRPSDQPGQASLAGGTARLLDVVRRVVRHAGVDLARAVTAASTTPAALLGLTDRGALAPGLRADVLVVDDDLRPLGVCRGGTWVVPLPAEPTPPTDRAQQEEDAWRS